MLHRVILGSMERFIGVLLEHYDFALPLWLAPLQVKILPVTSRAQEYALEVHEKLNGNYRVEVDLDSDTLGNKIRKAQQEKIPYMVIVGDKEMQNGTLSVRSLKDGDLGSINLDDFIKQLAQDLVNRR
jgi:threonyl-tRNA synthetase